MINDNIRNFCIISHIDHGKSTLADRFLELTKTVTKDKLRPQYLDNMPLERERGITIKLTPATMKYNFNGQNYIFNLIDTPGHVDFSYEVSRSLAAVEGAVLLVDASQGIQAQTLANLYLAQKQNLSIIPVINKIDLPSIDLEAVKKELMELVLVEADQIICVSAKNGLNVENILQAIANKVQPPLGDVDQPLKSLIFDSFFDDYRGVVASVRIFDGEVKAGDKIRFLATNVETIVLEVGVFVPSLQKREKLSAGEIGYIVTGLKDIEKCRVGDTIALASGEMIKPLHGYREPQSMVFAGLFLKEGGQPERLRQALIKLKLNDASLVFEPEHSLALGFGFRAGFLGLLHLDIAQERVKREYGLDLVITSPSVAYKIWLKGNGKENMIYSPSDLPDPSQIDRIYEPWMKVDIITPQEFLGGMMDLLSTAPQGAKTRTVFLSFEYLGQEKMNKQTRVIIHAEMPLSLLLSDFYDKVKSVSRGYASYSYQFVDYRPAEVSKLEILVANEPVDQFATIVYKDWAYFVGKKVVESLKEILPRQLFEVKLQAVIGGKILASEKIAAMRKDVTAKLYGGDVTRKNKLLDKQKKGKKKLMKFGKVNIPPEAYLAIIKR